MAEVQIAAVLDARGTANIVEAAAQARTSMPDLVEQVQPAYALAMGAADIFLEVTSFTVRPGVLPVGSKLFSIVQQAGMPTLLVHDAPTLSALVYRRLLRDEEGEYLAGSKGLVVRYDKDGNPLELTQQAALTMLHGVFQDENLKGAKPLIGENGNGRRR